MGYGETAAVGYGEATSRESQIVPASSSLGRPPRPSREHTHAVRLVESYLALSRIVTAVRTVRAAVDISRTIVSVSRTRQITLLAAGVAFYAFLSFVPLMLLVVGVAALVGGEAVAIYVQEAAEDVLTPSAQELLAEALVDDAGRRNATAVGAVGLIWAASRVFRGLDQAFARIYGTAGEKSILGTVRDGIVVAVAITLGLVLVALLEVAIALVPVSGIAILGPVFVLLALLAAFLPLYLVFPDVDLRVRDALPGALLAAVGWLVLSRTFSLYVSVVEGGPIYGALGAVFLVLIWLYLGAILLVFGAVVNAVLADRHRIASYKVADPDSIANDR